MSAFFYRRNGDEHGPLERRDLEALLDARMIGLDTPAREEGRSWSTAGSLLGREPPPLPDAALPAPDGSTATAEAGASATVVPPTAFTLGGDWRTEPVHPWRRYFARIIDYYSVGLICYMLLSVVLYATSSNLEATTKLVENRFFAAIANVVVCLPVLAVLIGLTGTTPGKLIAGVRVLDRDGKVLGIGRGFVREFNVALRGMGLSIPLVVLICNVGAYNALQADKASSWDRELGSVVWYRPSTPWVVLRVIVGLAVCATILGVLAAIGEKTT